MVGNKNTKVIKFQIFIITLPKIKGTHISLKQDKSLI